jgi:UDP-N-acetylglucosamine transferase subunit ALG13
MIFVTVGTQLPFDRLIRAIDEWSSGKPYADAFAQIGPAKYRPKHIPWAEFLDADECRRKTEQADVVVAHAGMGSILTALELGRPIIVMPRLSALGEHRNDHQLDTAKKLMAQGRIFIAFDENQLIERLDYLKKLTPGERIPVVASTQLLSTLETFVTQNRLVLPEKSIAGRASSRMASRESAAEQRALAHAESGEFSGQPATSGSTATVWYDMNPPGGASDDKQAGLGSSDRANRYGLRIALPSNQPVSSEIIRSRLTAVILLAGRLRLTDLGKRIGRSRLDLPIDANRSLLSYWRDQAAQLAVRWECKHLPVRVLLDQASLTPTLPAGVPEITMSIERDHAEFRGTGGLLSDICAGYDDDEWILVGNAAQILFEPLYEAVEKLAAAGGEVNVMNEDGGLPNGLILLRCGVLKNVAEVGFHDMKEQVVPAIAAHGSVKVVPSYGLTSPPIHSLEDYTTALRTYYRRNELTRDNPFDERWQPRFAIREQGSFVAESAVVHDSVILEGAAIEKGAVVVRSVIGRGARVKAGQVIMNQVFI